MQGWHPPPAAQNELETNLAADQEKLANLERGAQQAFKGYGGLRKSFLAATSILRSMLSGDDHRLLAALQEHIGKGETN
jgi:hypothetical protein